MPEEGGRGEEVHAPTPVVSVESLPDQAEERLGALVKVETVARFLRGELDELQIPEPFEAIPRTIGVGVDRGVAQLWPRLDVEEEQQPVHVSDALQTQVARQAVVKVVDALATHLAQVPDRLVADELDRLAHGILQVG